MYDFIFSSSSTASRCSACRTSTSPTSSISVTFPWGRSTSSPSSSWAVWSCCGSSRPPRLPSSSPWWWVDSSHSTPGMSKNHKLFLQQLTFFTCRCWLWCLSGSWWTASSARESWAGWTTSCPRARRRSWRTLMRWWHWRPIGPSFLLHFSVEVHWHCASPNVSRRKKRRSRVSRRRRTELCKCH